MLEEILNITKEITIEIDKKHIFEIYKHFYQKEDILKLDFGSNEINLKDYQVDGFLFENGKVNLKYI